VQIKAQQAAQQQLRAKLRKAQADLDTWRAQVHHVQAQWKDTQARNSRLRADNEAIRAAIASQQAAANWHAAHGSHASPQAAAAPATLQLPNPVPWAFQWNCPSPTPMGFMHVAPAGAAAAAAAGSMGHSNSTLCRVNSSTAIQGTMLPAGSWGIPPLSPAGPAAATAGYAALGMATAHSVSAGGSSWCYGDERPLKVQKVQAEAAADTWSSGHDSWASDVWHPAAHTPQEEVVGPGQQHQPWQGHMQLGIARSCGSSGSDHSAVDALPKVLSNSSATTGVYGDAAGAGGVSPSDDPLDLLLADDTCWGSESLEDLMGLLAEDGEQSGSTYLPAKHPAAAAAAAELLHVVAVADASPHAAATQCNLPAVCCEAPPLHMAACDWVL
jgi:hypothetical protein